MPTLSSSIKRNAAAYTYANYKFTMASADITKYSSKNWTFYFV